MANAQSVYIVIAEDCGPDIILFKEALRSAEVHADLKVFSDGEKCADYFRTTEESPPDLIVLDLNLPKVNGFDLIRLVRENRRYDKVPVAVLTSSTAAKDKNLSLDLGANTFVSKPSRLDEFLETVGSAILTQLGRIHGTGTLHLTWEPGPKPPAGRRRRYCRPVIAHRQYLRPRSCRFSIAIRKRSSAINTTRRSGGVCPTGPAPA